MSVTSIKLVEDLNQPLIKMRAGARFFLDSYQVSKNYLVETKGVDGRVISSQAIPGFVNLLFSVELLLKLAYCTDRYLNEKSEFDFDVTAEYLKKFNHKLSSIVDEAWVNLELHKFMDGEFSLFLSTYENAFVNWRYFFEKLNLETHGVDELFSKACKLYELILNVHKESNDPYLALTPSGAV
jgi:hypothetical protein